MTNYVTLTITFLQCGLSYTDVARTLFMCEKSVQMYLTIFHATGSVDPQILKRGPDKCLTEFELFTIVQTVIIKPTSFLCKIQHQLLCSTGRWVHASTICNAVKKQGLTHKRVQTIALQQIEAWRIEYMTEISQFHPDMLIWIDETGSERRNSIRKYGYSLRLWHASSGVLTTCWRKAHISNSNPNNT